MASHAIMPPSRAQMVSLMRSVSSSLKPVDVILLSYLLVTAPLLFVVHDDDDVAWGGFFCRLVIAPLVVTGRYYLAFTDPADLPTSIHIATIRSHKLVFPPALLALLVLDLYPLVVCMYLYAEDGKLIHNLYSSGFFYDRQLHLIDAAVFGVPLEAGLSNYIRSQGSELFNKVCGRVDYTLLAIAPVGTVITNLCSVCPLLHFSKVVCINCRKMIVAN